MGSEMTPSLFSYGGPLWPPPMGATESDTPWEVGLRKNFKKKIIGKIFGYFLRFIQL